MHIIIVLLAPLAINPVLAYQRQTPDLHVSTGNPRERLKSLLLAVAPSISRTKKSNDLGLERRARHARKTSMADSEDQMQGETYTDLQFGDEASLLLRNGVDAVADVVKKTLGPQGSNIILSRGWDDLPDVINDGVTIARDIVLDDPREDIGARLVVEVASATDERAGDGTTTSAILAQSLTRTGLRMNAYGCCPILMQVGLRKGVDILIDKIKNLSRPVESNDDIRNVATISTGSAEMGRTLANILERVGKNGAVTTEDSKSLFDEIEITEGIEIDRGYLSEYFVNDKSRGVCELNNPRILLYDGKIEDLNELVKPLEHFIETEQPVVIIAEDIVGEALSSLVLNNNRNVLKVCAIKAPSFGERRNDYLEDIAVLTGATFVTAALGLTLRDVTPEMFGKAQKCTVGKEKSTFISTGEFKEAAEERMEYLKEQMKTMDSEYDLEKFGDRVARLGGSIGRIRVGGPSETILRDKKLRYEDAINSCKKAMELGVLPGGGSVFVYLQRFKDEVRAQVTNEEVAYGIDLLFEAIQAPIHVLAQNCGQLGDIIYDEVAGKDFGYGWNAETEEFGDLYEMGVLDPASVTIESLRNAVSVASCVITCGGLVTDIPFSKLDMLGDLAAEKEEDYDDDGAGSELSDNAGQLLKKLNTNLEFLQGDDEEETGNFGGNMAVQR